MTIDPTTSAWPAPAQLAQLLGRWARGYYPDEAAVGILVRGCSGIWLRRADFLNACVRLVEDTTADDLPIDVAVVEWESVPAFIAPGIAASTGEVSILKAAASVAGVAAWSMREVTQSLDVDNAAVVLDALAQRAGWHEHGITRTVSGFGSWPAFSAPITERGAALRGGLPSFEDTRAAAYRLLGDAADWLRSDWRPGTGPTARGAAAVGDAMTAIGQAKAALNRAAR